MIVEDKIEIMAGRWPASAVRCLPYLAIKAELPLKIVLLLFSLSYMLFHFIVFAILRWIMKEKKIANFYALWLLLISGHAFFWNNSELIQACSVLFILMALVKKEQSGPLRWVGIFATIVLLLFYHPLVIIPIVGVLAFWILQNPKRSKEYLIYLISAVVFYILKSKLFTNWYDSGKQDEFSNNMEEYGLGILSTPGFKHNILSFFTGWNLIITVFAFAAMYFFYKEKKWLCLLALPAGIFLYNILIALADPKIGYAFYNEVNFIPLMAIILLGCMQLSHKVMDMNVVWIALLVFFVFRVSYDGRFYSDRIDYWKNVLVEVETKTLRKESEMDMSKLVMSWGSPYESLLIHKLQGEKNEKTVLVHPNISQFKDYQNPSMFFTHFKPYTIDEVNHRYFSLSNTVGYK